MCNCRWLKRPGLGRELMLVSCWVIERVNRWASYRESNWESCLVSNWVNYSGKYWVNCLVSSLGSRWERVTGQLQWQAKPACTASDV